MEGFPRRLAICKPAGGKPSKALMIKTDYLGYD